MGSTPASSSATHDSKGVTHDQRPAPAHPHNHASTVAGPHSTPLDAAAEVIDRHLLLFRWGAYATAAGCVVVAFFAAKRLPLFAVARTPAELAALTSPASPAGRLRRTWVCLEGRVPVGPAAVEAEHAESAVSAASAAAAQPGPAAPWARAAVPVLAVRHVPLLAAWVLPRSLQTAWAGPTLHVSPYALAPSSATEARAIEDSLLRDYGVGPRGRLLAATVCELRPAADEAAELAVCRLYGRRQGHLRRQDASHATLATGQSAFDHEALLRAEQWPGAPQWCAGLESLRDAEAAARLAGCGRWREDAAYARPVPRLSGGLRAAWDRVVGAVRRWRDR
jgi:hypothetical protein